MQIDIDNREIYKQRAEKLESVKIKIDDIKSKMSRIEKEILEIKQLDRNFTFKDSIDRVKKRKIYKVDNIIFFNNLMYQRFPDKNLYSWQEAIEYGDSLEISNYRGWRLPTIDELEALFTKQNRLNSHGDSHYIIRDFLEAMPTDSIFWSISQENEPYAWVADFSRGYDYWRLKKLKYHALFVRDIK